MDASTSEHAVDQLPLGLGDDVPVAPRLFVEVEAPAAPEPEVDAATDDATGELFGPEPARPCSAPTLSLGARLRNAREARGLGLDDAARALRIPSSRVADIEADRFESLGPAVYLRGYLRSYARLVGLPEVVVSAALEGAHAAPPALVATRTVSRSHYFTSRYGSLLVYGVLTAVFVVPLLWAARQGALRPESRAPLATLDAGSADFPAAVPPQRAADPAAATAVAMPGELAGPPESLATPAAEPQAIEPPRPVMATMAPMASKPASAPASAGRRVTLALSQASWIELIGDDGTRIEYALLPAGSSRTYELYGGANLRIGNTRGASLSVDGAAVDLAKHTRSNVARVPIAARAVESR
ncbi:MAG TPA: RodZ domain-containing protein [Xanthomonadales bacterium]|nr:RodZ domain-containing protein [Xanthomonadales bacterium]